MDINDLAIVLTKFGQTGMTWAQGEFTGDGKVDVNDLTIVLANFGDPRRATRHRAGAFVAAADRRRGRHAGRLCFAAYADCSEQIGKHVGYASA